MNRYILRNVFIARMAALALCAICFLQTPVRAQGMIAVIVIFPSVGLAHNTGLRLTLFNPAGEPVRVQARVHHAGGVLVGLADGSVRGGAFLSFNFNRGVIPLAGEEGTGRVQLNASFHITMSEPGRKIGKLTFSMETISISDGTSNTVFAGEVLPSRARGNGNDFIIDGFGNDIMVGIPPGKTLRATLSYVPSRFVLRERGSFEESEPIGARVKVFDGSGNLIAQSGELVIPQGESRSYDLDRDALSLAGEPGTGRLQMRGTWQLRISDAASQDVGQVAASFELIDKVTGKTEVLAGQECLVFFLGGIPGNQGQ